MSFANSITRSPTPYDASIGADARVLFGDFSGALADLLVGAAGCSPYLWGLMQKEQLWLTEALEASDPVGDELCAASEASAADLPVALRQAKRRVALYAALADLGGVWSLPQVTGALTQLADDACALALRAALGAEIKRGKLPGMSADDLKDAAGMVVLAMGKMGAGELNYSSDIDLICLFDESRFERDDFHDARASFVRATRRMAAMLNDRTSEGYVFRTDLRLRPDPAVTPVCMAMEAAERYYESLGRTWERAAYIKARAAAGDISAGERFLSALRPFVWRRHLDFAAIQDAHDMRLRIRAHKGLGGPISLKGHNMKLGRGGIREIEFFTQTRQLIAGGRDPELRMRGTVEGLEKLAEKGWIKPEISDTLSAHYTAHREVEHRLQMINDAQTHDLPSSPEGMARLACFMGQEQAIVEQDLHDRLSEVHTLTEGFFAPDAAPVVQAEPEFGGEIMQRWQSYPALRSPRAVEIFERVKPEVMRRLSRAAKPEEALIAFDGFLSGLPAGVQVFSLFDANPQLIDLLVDIVSTSTALASHLSRNSAVFDAVIGGDFFSEWPGEDALCAELNSALSQEPDYEAALDMARRWAKEWHFRIGVHHLRGLSDGAGAAAQYADLAGAVLRALWPLVGAEFAHKHGGAPGRGAVVLGMGSLGAGRLNAGSDLDLIVIYDADGVEASEGRRPLAARQYYARLTQALVTALSAPMSQGRLYEVDMRLRPSGNKGPVATSWAAFQTYQQNDAWIWEHLALTRARVIAQAGEKASALGDEVEAFRQALIGKGQVEVDVLQAVSDMRARIRAAKPSKSAWEMKLGAGRMQDIELISQAGALIAGSGARDVMAGLASGVANGWLSDADRAALSTAYGLCWEVQMAARLLSDAPLTRENMGVGGAAMLRRVTAQASVEDLTQTIETATSAAARVISTALPEPQTGDSQ